MTQEEKDLLLKDLSARLPYGVKFRVIVGDTKIINTVDCLTNCRVGEMGWRIDLVKPYLFPLSSITKEQRENFYNKNHLLINREDCKLDVWGFSALHPYEAGLYIDFLLSHHFDFRGLIEKGLAIDATGLNIY